MTLDDHIIDLVRRAVREEMAALRPAVTPAPEPAFKPSSEYVDERELAKWLNASIETIQSWRGRREGPPYIKMGSRCVRYHVPTVREWMSGQRRGSR